MQASERRYVESRPVVTRVSGSERRFLTGLAAATGKKSLNLGGATPWKERIRTGAFKDTLARRPKVYCLLNHEVSRILGHSGDGGSLSVWESERGLEFRCELGTGVTADEAYQFVSSNAIQECSFGFTVAPGDDEWGDEYDDEFNRRIPIRTVKRVAQLLDVSPCTFPAYAGVTHVSASTAAAAGRSLWPMGLIPESVRSHVSSVARIQAPATDAESENLRDYARAFLARIHSEDLLNEINGK